MHPIDVEQEATLLYLCESLHSRHGDVGGDLAEAGHLDVVGVEGLLVTGEEHLVAVLLLDLPGVVGVTSRVLAELDQVHALSGSGGAEIEVVPLLDPEVARGANLEASAGLGVHQLGGDGRVPLNAVGEVYAGLREDPAGVELHVRVDEGLPAAVDLAADDRHDLPPRPEQGAGRVREGHEVGHRLLAAEGAPVVGAGRGALIVRKGEGGKDDPRRIAPVGVSPRLRVLVQAGRLQVHDDFLGGVDGLDEGLQVRLAPDPRDRAAGRV